MCGIYGYIGPKEAANIVINGLKRLDYRGYDSWGIGILNSGKIQVEKQVGTLDKVSTDSTLVGNVGIGHTRWATHGAVTQANAHPHAAVDGSFVLAQNGIVENFDELKSALIEKNALFLSETDTEVIVRLIEEAYKSRSLLEAVRYVYTIIKGRNTIILLSKDGSIIAARNGSPLVVGKQSATGEIFLSSDMLSFAPYVSQAQTIENGEMVYCKGQEIKVIDIATGQEKNLNMSPINIKEGDRDKHQYEHHMIKEIADSPEAINAVLSEPEFMDSFIAKLRQSRRVFTIGSGTAGIASAQIALYLILYAKIDATSLIGADAKDYIPLISKGDLVIAPSQSGETADVLEVLEKLKEKGVSIATYVNMPGSMMTRMADFPFMANAGPEICVMSTKIFTSQIVWGYYISRLAIGQRESAKTELKSLADAISDYLKNENNHKEIIELAEKMSTTKDIFMLGAFENFQIVREGMVKLIEGTYKHAHAIPAGDLKHYAITLIEKGSNVMISFSKDAAFDDVMNSASQVKARGAYVIGVGPANDGRFDRVIKTPSVGTTQAIMNIIPFQLLAYYLAKKLGNNIDKPRNIAKSVTVK